MIAVEVGEVVVVVLVEVDHLLARVLTAAACTTGGFGLLLGTLGRGGAYTSGVHSLHPFCGPGPGVR
jgi:hypothetical protein